MCTKSKLLPFDTKQGAHIQDAHSAAWTVCVPQVQLCQSSKVTSTFGCRGPNLCDSFSAVKRPVRAKYNGLWCNSNAGGI